ISHDPSGTGPISDHARHVQCPWRFDGPLGTVTRRDDLREYAGPGKRPEHWSYDDGFSLQDERLSHFFARDERTRSWVNASDRFLVIGARQTDRGDVRIDLADGYTLVVFPAGYSGESWRLFAPGSSPGRL